MLTLWLLALVAHAHPPSYSSFYAELDHATVQVTLDVHPPSLADVVPAIAPDGDGELTRQEVADGTPEIQEAILGGISVGSNTGPCVAGPPSSLRYPADTRLLLDVAFRCDGVPTSLHWTVSLLMEDDGGHTVVGQIRTPAGYVRHVFTPAERTVTLDAASPRRPARVGLASASPDDAPAPPSNDTAPLFVAFVREGIHHILGGWDHLAFVLALAAGAPAWRSLGWTVTAFTVGHSASLAMVAIDLLRLPAQVVEPLIAASIVWVAVENLRGTATPHRPWTALVFGFLHGFGFGSALREMALPSAAVVPSLLGFNVGVELGQLALLLPVVPVLAWLSARHPVAHRRAAQALSAAVAGLGTAWFLDRVTGWGAMPF